MKRLPPGAGWDDGSDSAGARADTTNMSPLPPTSNLLAPAGVETSGPAALTWANPTDITVAIANHTINGQGIGFSHPLPPNAISLLQEAERAWEAVANVHFVNVDDSGSTAASAAEIRVGLAQLSSMGFIGYTSYSWDGHNNFRNGTVVALNDVGAGNVTSLANGNARFNGDEATVFQDLLHELGHALGLAHNPYNPASIMNPTLGSSNPYINSQDATALRALYGAPSASAVSEALADPTLTALLPWPGAATV